MEAATIETVKVPDHVPHELVRDYDIFKLIKPTEDFHDAWHAIVRNEPPVFYAPRYGGYWVVNRADLLDQVWPDAELYYSGDGIGIPPDPSRPANLPIEADGTYHKELRKPLNMALSPKAVVALSERARALAVKLVEEVAPKGRCEFIHDFSYQMPMELFLHIVDLPSSDRAMLIKFAHDSLKHPEIEGRRASAMKMMDYLLPWIAKRSEQPGDDFMSAVVNMEVEGRALNHTEQIGYMLTVMFGGLDTVAGTMGLTAKYLATHPEHRRLLVERPELIPAAVEEIVRRHSIPIVSRSVRRDVELGGAPLKAGDRVMLVTMIHGMDDRKWEDADEMRLDRANARDHMAFGRGPHRCPGAILARAEIRIFIEEWLKRIPEFSLDPEGEVEFECGSVSGLARLPLVWPVA